MKLEIMGKKHNIKLKNATKERVSSLFLGRRGFRQWSIFSLS
jgi:hypothetical protein